MLRQLSADTAVFDRESQRVRQRTRAFEWHQRASEYVFWAVHVILAVGLLSAVVEFARASSLSRKGIDETSSGLGGPPPLVELARRGAKSVGHALASPFAKKPPSPPQLPAPTPQVDAPAPPSPPTPR